MYNNAKFRAQCAECVTVDGLWLEFGVYQGESVRHWLANGAPHVYGFDTWEGLPEDWRPGYTRGHFNCGGNPPEIPGFTPIKGLIEHTLPQFLQGYPGPCALVHVDTDIYSAAEFELRTLRLAGRLVAGTVVVFDELAGHIGWREHEWRAASEQLFPFFHCVPCAGRVNENGCIRAGYLLYNR